MWLLALKLTITPAVIASATVAARRFGPAVGGWLVGLPLTCAPVVLFVAVERGPTFAAHVSSGAVAGVTAEAAFVLGYVGVALRGRGWLPSLAVGSVAFVAAGFSIDQVHPPLVVLLGCAVVSLLVGLRLVPRTPRAVWPQKRWDLPLRMALTTSLVLLVTGFAGTLGPGVSGIATTYPLITSTLAIALHRAVGADAAIAVYRGLLLGVFALTAFASTAVLVLTRLPLGGAFLVALLITVVAQLGSLPAARRAHAV
jgi:hypothetical protein